MKIILNNREEVIDRDTITLEELIQYKSYTFKLLVTKINDQLVKKDDRKITHIKDGDKVVVLHMISGG
ncbi:MAG: thiamine biosynthesis protein ThiS [Bacteroidetes bacterium HGW-Bacteroidetes-17]|jgi:thiamine biosynthesis protein ThiS|nr:MAG: thiamine biosynthesis protein ThiS [Bacteroidetes bacterium HGW-Bacteroidetes-17]